MGIAKHVMGLGLKPRVKAIAQKDERHFEIQWTDGKTQRFDVVDLRRKCPCATCKDEWTHEQILDPKSVPETVRPMRIESVGQYALTIQFSDGHRTGIYPFTSLRKLGGL
jgi:ATP-binding protein involved in chromosome partitioning